MWVFHSILIINNYPKVLELGVKKKYSCSYAPKKSPALSPPGTLLRKRKGREQLGTSFYEINMFVAIAPTVSYL